MAQWTLRSRQTTRRPECVGGRPRTLAVPAAAAVALLLAALVSGCEFRIRAGEPPNIAALDSGLTVGASRPDDVRAALGEPYGKGRAMFPFQPSPRTVWSYYYEEGDTKDTRRTILYVFLDEDVYDGYIWFSSLPQ